MLETRIRAKADLDKGIKKTYLDALLATKDNEAHQIDVQLFRGQAQAQIDAGAAVSGYFIRYSDNATVPLEGSVSGNIASVKLTRACYSKPGQFALIIKVLIDDVVSTIFYGEGSIFASSTDTYVDEENVIPSLEDLLAQIATMESGTKAANTAAGNANTAAGSANTAAGNANTAAGNANNAAAKIDGMTVSASSSTTAGATISEKNGVKHIAFKLPKGEPGTTPAITFEATTGAAGSDVLLEQSGTAEAPVIKLTIPRGDTGSVDGIDYYEGNPAALGTASPGTANGVARGNHVHPMPSAADVGALGKDAQANDSAKLGGQLPEYYAKQETVSQLSQQIGNKLGKTEQAADSAKLGGQLPEYYAKQETVSQLSQQIGNKLGKTEQAADSAKLGGKAPAYYTPYTNLADNSDFTHWVAQAGIGGKHGTETYGGDRWILTSGTIASTANGGDPNPDGDGYSGIQLNGTLVQVVPSHPSVATAFVEMVSGTAEISYDASEGEITLRSAGGVIKNVLLLEGEWAEKPPYVPKGYALELAECLRYYRHLNGGWYYGIHIAGSGYFVVVPAETQMRCTPTPVCNNLQTYDSTEYWKDASAINIEYLDGVYKILLEVTSNSIEANKNFMINGLIALSADL